MTTLTLTIRVQVPDSGYPIATATDRAYLARLYAQTLNRNPLALNGSHSRCETDTASLAAPATA